MADSSKEEMAHKAQALAEKSFLAANVSGARQWMLSAVGLAPDLPGNAQAVAAYDVHAAAAARRPPDWYVVLGLPDPRTAAVTHDAIKRQHRKLCLLVHPDKNSFAAADGAFKLVQAAWDVLSARHPPSSIPTPPQAPPPPRPPDPPTRPQPPPRPRVVQMQRRADATKTSRYSSQPTPRVPTASYSQKAARAPQQQRARRRMSPPPSTRPPSPTAGRCPSCGASTPCIGKSNFRCMSCQWSPMDGRHDYDYDDGYYY